MADAYPADLEGDLSGPLAALRIRPIRADDADALVRFHDGLSRESQYLRFYSTHPHLSAREVLRFTVVDYRNRLALVIETGGDLIAVGRFDRLVGTSSAEVAFAVADAYHHRGLATLLLQRLAGAARDRGIDRFFAETLPMNQPMLAVFHESGFPVVSRFEGNLVRVEFPITGPVSPSPQPG
jgi:GNAT superfamily N-acetyltransferase